MEKGGSRWGILRRRAEGITPAAMPVKQAPISLRPGKAREPLIASYAAEHGISPAAAILAIFDVGAERLTAPPSQPTIGPHLRDRVQQGRDALAQAEAAAAHLAKPRKRWNVGSRS